MAVVCVALTVAVAAKNRHTGKHSVTDGPDLAVSNRSKSSGSTIDYADQLDTSGMWDNRLDDAENALEAFAHQPSEPAFTHQPAEPICATSLQEKSQKLTTRL